MDLFLGQLVHLGLLILCTLMNSNLCYLVLANQIIILNLARENAIIHLGLLILCYIIAILILMARENAKKKTEEEARKKTEKEANNSSRNDLYLIHGDK